MKKICFVETKRRLYFFAPQIREGKGEITGYNAKLKRAAGGKNRYLTCLEAEIQSPDAVPAPQK